MKRTVKLLALFTLLSLSLQAQLKLPISSAFVSDMKKVIADHPNRYDHIRGEVIAENPQTIDYRCNLDVNGAEESRITGFPSKKNIYSWEAVMLTTESFDKAKQKFRSLYQQLNNISVDLGDNQRLRFKGDYEAPKEEKKFTTVVFKADQSSKLQLELSLRFQEPMEWKVLVLVYDREREDEERGSRTEQ